MADTFTAAQKLKARSLCIYAIRSGALVRQPCEKCGSSEKTEAHHDDYSRPLDVRWLCRPCHNVEHRGPRLTRRNSHCQRGHALTGHNLMLVKTADGLMPKRKCRECQYARDNQRRKSI